MRLIKIMGISSVLVLGLLFFTTPKQGLSYPVPPLPEDNLVSNPWFRSTSDPRAAGLDGWTNVLQNGIGWDLSQKESNPSPEIIISGVCGFKEVYCGTGARWANETINKELYSHPGIDAVIYQIIPADPSHRKLKFSMYWVNHKLEVFEVKIYGSALEDGPWQEVWSPFYLTQDVNPPPSEAPGRGENPWLNTDILEAVFEKGYSYYKLELHARYGEADTNHGDVGVKVTGIYFATEKTDAPADISPIEIILHGTWTKPSQETTRPNVAPTNPPQRTRVPTATLVNPTSAPLDLSSPFPTKPPVQSRGTPEPQPTRPPLATSPPSGLMGVGIGVFLVGGIVLLMLWQFLGKQKEK